MCLLLLVLNNIAVLHRNLFAKTIIRSLFNEEDEPFWGFSFESKLLTLQDLIHIEEMHRTELTYGRVVGTVLPELEAFAKDLVPADLVDSTYYLSLRYVLPSPLVARASPSYST